MFAGHFGVVAAVKAKTHWLLDLLVHRPNLPILPGLHISINSVRLKSFLNL